MTILTAPASPLSDGVVELRPPSPDAGDVATIDRYVENEQLDGAWLPEVPLISGEELVADWQDGWAGRRSRNGPAFVVTVKNAPGFVGVVGVAEGDDGAFELAYGTAPGWRKHGLASRATQLAAQWVASQPSVRTVEAWIDQGQPISERVAVNAGFALAETLTRTDPDSGRTVVLRYVMDKPAPTE